MEMPNKSLDDLLREIDYSRFKKSDYTTEQFGMEFITFIKWVNDGVTQNKSPLAHLELINAFNNEKDVLGCCHRGFAKSSLVMYLFLWIAVFGGLPKFGSVNYALYVSDTIENGVKTMKQNLDSMINNSQNLQKVLDMKKTKILSEEWEFCNKDGHYFTVKGFGAATGVRGTRKYNSRPQLAVFDDLLTDKNAKSDAIIATIEDTIYDAVRHALDTEKRKTIWIGTPFDKKDPLYKAISSGAWTTLLFPVCQEFPCEKEDFIGSWEDRFTYDFVKSEYEFAMLNNRIQSFNKELMLRIISDEDRLIPDTQLLWYDRDYILQNKHKYNFYLTSDFATSEKQKADYTVISIWAYSHDKKWYWVDGIVKRQDFGKTLDDIFRFAKNYDLMSAAFEISGQQKGFVSVIQKEMLERNIYFPLATDKNSVNGEVGIRPNKSKLERFNMVLPLFQNQRIYFPKCLQQSLEMVEAMDELRHVSKDGFKSAHDDFADTVSQLQFLNEIAPGEETDTPLEDSVDDSIFDVDFSVFDEYDTLDDTYYSSYMP